MHAFKRAASSFPWTISCRSSLLFVTSVNRAMFMVQLGLFSMLYCTMRSSISPILKFYVHYVSSYMRLNTYTTSCKSHQAYLGNVFDRLRVIWEGFKRNKWKTKDTTYRCHGNEIPPFYKRLFSIEMLRKQKKSNCQ